MKGKPKMSACETLLKNYTFETYAETKPTEESTKESDDVNRKHSTTSVIMVQGGAQRKNGVVLTEHDKVYLKPKLKKEMIKDSMKDYNFF